MRRATLYTLIAALLWGTTFPTIRIGLEWGHAEPFTFAYLRFFLATVAVAAVAIPIRRFDWDMFSSPGLWGLAVLNVAGYAMQFVAQGQTTASKTSLLVDIDVVVIAVLGYWFLRERHGKEIVIALLLGTVGVALLSTNGDLETVSFNNREFVGDVLAFAAGLVWAVYFVGVKAWLEKRPQTDGVAFTLAVFTLTTIGLFPLAWGFEGLHGTGNATAWMMILYLGLLPTALAFLLWQEALRTESVTVTSVLLLLEIVVAVAIAVAFLDERLTGWALVGALLIAIAALVASRTPAPPLAPPAIPAAGPAREQKS